MEDATAVVRRFNRAYTQRIGALEESFLGMGLPLGTARLLFEIGSGPTTTQALRARLGLDSGYLSRLLRRLEEDGLVVVKPDPDDRRRRLVGLTETGRRRWQELDDRSEERARRLVEPLSERQRARLAAALSEADLLVRAATVTFEPVDPRGPVARVAVDRYFAEIGRRFGFEATGQAEQDGVQLAAPHGIFLVARDDGQPVACGGVRTIADGVGEVKRMWVDDRWRGVGLGSRLLRQLEDAARALGHRAARLDTNESLAAAIALYGRAGYRRTARYNDNPYATHFFEKTLTAPTSDS
ncbi:bifunctional helix-turn-helix transcriptional regulator/GNAT family N-acetyltransferase [Frankia sp. AgB1.9]|uniref:bifunctional helix-turn-helix transcriptional regulator/GNAT family N-acetyltransferase n=1 Tax=unclassified Frankia TaxID=2632575 RepID=UPI0019316111|nr:MULTISPECIES: bifunctional helix-turn-helix transcriptional regulator/GNAT family N-acetyltransferase [unclassified Frankia]MBL7493426.1 bifunctional helix-turn-helix transcriptional regulator/GNAT family N-acetyltransferase [Frankia sp. AgW1.1]MBL7549055.1 bifunctional helix-turn-helix transcriptional regulator/GNAT family N-acetyltransferase [Frankia sp. AgB1.9]MBL7624300.1 bifunctional helix-turn-helix transcriptional regulator/GNAT family N-acetyltransferase [Frankia sp. AgB1.8]